MMAMTVYTEETLRLEVVAPIRQRVRDMMFAFGCDVSGFSKPDPVICFLTFEEAVQEARAEGYNMPVEELRKRFNQMEGGFDIQNNRLCFKKGSTVGEDLLVHELIHSCQNAEVLLELSKDISDPFRLGTFIEMEAYMLQYFWAVGIVERSLTRARVLERTPYEHMVNWWNTIYRGVIEAQINKAS